jgi:hypothetical protein
MSSDLLKYAPSEFAIISQPKRSELRLDRFYRFWTLKESVIKAAGGGMPAYDLAGLEFSPSATSEFWREEYGGKEDERLPSLDTTVKFANAELYPEDRWIFELSYLNSRHCVAVCLDAEALMPGEDEIGTRIRTITAEELLADSCPCTS